MNHITHNLLVLVLGAVPLLTSPGVYAQTPADDLTVISRPYYVYENKSFELEFLVSGNTTSWNPRPYYLVDGTDIVVFYERIPQPGPSPAPPLVDILVVQEISGLPAGEYSVYVAPYSGGESTAFNFAGTPRGTITVYPGAIDLDLGLGSPKPDEIVGGVGVIRGWACYSQDFKPVATTIGTISYQIDNTPLKPVPYGTSRGDVTERCLGNESTGFAAPINWNRFSVGEHVFKLFVDGQEVVSQSIVVSGTGETFLRGLDAEYELSNFPSDGDTTTVKWSQSAQDFTIVDVVRSQAVPE